MSWDIHEGILLQAIPYLGTRKILKVLTPQAGLLTLMSTQKTAPFPPFCQAEWVIRSKHADIHFLKESSLIDPFEPLRSRFDILSAAGSIAHDILSSEWSHDSFSIYHLVLSCLKHLPKAPATLKAAFRLKLLTHEGLLRLQPLCTECDQHTSFLQEGASVCAQHALSHSVAIQEEERNLLIALSQTTRIAELVSLHVPKHTLDKLDYIFLERWKN